MHPPASQEIRSTRPRAPTRERVRPRCVVVGGDLSPAARLASPGAERTRSWRLSKVLATSWHVCQVWQNLPCGRLVRESNRFHSIILSLRYVNGLRWHTPGRFLYPRPDRKKKEENASLTRRAWRAAEVLPAGNAWWGSALPVATDHG